MTQQNSEEIQRLIERYRQDMMSQFIAFSQQSSTEQTSPAPPAQASPQPTDASNEEATDIGQLQVRVSTENQAVPLPGAVVTITKETNGERELIRNIVTDESGLTPLIDLKTKDRNLSLIPGEVAPYTLYTVEVVADGYFPKTFIDLPIYGGVVAVQSVSMIPLPENGDDDVVLTYPQSAPKL